MEGHPVQIVTYDKHQNRYRIIDDHLDQILKKPKFRFMKVAVIAFSGPSRIGKSFVLSYFIRYMKNQDLGDEDIPMKDGFKWTSSTKRETTGIYAWSELIVCDSPSGKVAVMLLDTQGSFDGRTEDVDQAILFALSTMVSSVQVYNANDLQDNTLFFLKHFLEYGKQQAAKLSSSKYADQPTTHKKPFQNLLFLVRDWKFPVEFDYGMKGGTKYVDSVLEPSGRPENQMSSRMAISECFETIEGFLLPHPGNGITKRDFDGRLRQLDPDFVHYMAIFIETIVWPGNIQIKIINGEQADCLMLRRYFQMCETILNHRQDLGMTLEVGINQSFFVASYQKALNEYMQGMARYMNSVGRITEFELMMTHSALIENAVQTYQRSIRGTSFTSEEAHQKAYKDKLASAIDDVLQNVVKKYIRKRGGFLPEEDEDVMASYNVQEYDDSEVVGDDRPSPEEDDGGANANSGGNNETPEADEREEALVTDMVKETDKSFWSTIIEPAKELLSTFGHAIGAGIASVAVKTITTLFSKFF